MKNEDRILELLTETLQRIDRQQEELDRQQSEMLVHRNVLIELEKGLRQMREEMAKEQPLVRDVLKAHESAIHTLHLSSLQQQDTMQQMTQLLVAQNQKLIAHDEKLARL